MRGWMTVALCLGTALAAGCATQGNQADEPRETPAYRTGSMIPKKDRTPSDVQTVDPNAVRDALGGKPPSVRPGG